MLLAIAWLTLAIVLALSPLTHHGDAQHHREPAATSGAANVPEFVRVYNQDGRITGEWTARQYGVVGWLREPERLVFLTYTSRGYTLVAGDPATGALYELTPMTPGWLERTSDPTILLHHAANAPRRITLPGPLVEPTLTAGYPTTAGELRVVNNEVHRRDALLLPDRGLAHTLLASPSGRWAAAIEQQRQYTYAIYSIDINGGNPSLERMVSDAELPLDLAQGRPLSPNRQWVVTVGSVQTMLRGADGSVRILPVGSASPPLWNADSSAFLLRTTDGILAVNTLDATLKIVIHNAAPIIGWRNNRILWLSATIGSDE